MNYYQPRQVDPESDRPDAGKWRDRFAKVGTWRMFVLCDPHRTREIVAGLFGVVGDSISSY